MQDQIIVTKANRTPEHLRHPDWCGRGIHCTGEVSQEGFAIGQHYEAHRPLPTTYGTEVAVGLMADVLDENDPRVSVRFSGVDTDFTTPHGERWPFDGLVVLEPEEAEQLARYLTEAAERWRTARRDHIPSE